MARRSKLEGTCVTIVPSHGGVPMLSRIQSLGSCLIVLTLLLFAGSAGAQDVSPRCEAAMDRAAGHYSKCLLFSRCPLCAA